MEISRGDPGALRAYNRRTTLNHIRRLGPTSRTQLAELTGLSAASVSGVTAELIGERLLVERSVGEAGATGGRRPIYLDIDYAAHFAVGFKLREDRIEAVLTDLSLTVLAHHTEALEEQEPARVAVQIRAIVRRLIRRAKVKGDDLIGIGIGLSGIVDARSGVAVHAPLLHWEDVPLARLVMEATGLPTWVDNDANSFAAAQRLFGHGKQAGSFLTVAVGRGVGAALVINGEVYRGRNGGAGEIGHSVVRPGGRPCTCGRRGCLETYTAVPGLLEHLNAERESPIPDLSALLDLAAQGDTQVLDALHEAGSLLGLHLSHLVNTFNPELIVIGGEGAALGEAYFGPLRGAVTEYSFGNLAADLPIVTVPWDSGEFTSWAQGAASLAIQSAFDAGAIVKSLPTSAISPGRHAAS
ncbi:ROK family protein [Deinococcus altitudinis]|uniref:ROK family protein n=1 Tax=Deinococcus altitudinis TaxID=468914 RepID=UPI00389134E1